MDAPDEGTEEFDRAAGLRDHIGRMNFAFQRAQAWCDVLHAMGYQEDDLNPKTLFGIAEALIGVLNEMKRDWSALANEAD